MSLTLYSLSPICHRCVMMDPLIEQICHQKGIELVRNGFLTSVWFLLARNLKPPVLIFDGRVVVSGRLLSKDELVDLLDVFI